MSPGFPRACNAAQPSPSGRYIAVLVDGPMGLVILRKEQGYRYDGWAAPAIAGSSAQSHLDLTEGAGDRPPWAAPLPIETAGAVFGEPCLDAAPGSSGVVV